MTLHIRYHHQCPECSVEYLPYDSDVPCPHCGLVEQERFDFVAKAVESARFNIRQVESYVPMAWVVLSHGDEVLSLLFRLLEHARTNTEAAPFAEWALDYLGTVDWGDAPYYRDYVYRIAVRVHLELQRE